MNGIVFGTALAVWVIIGAIPMVLWMRRYGDVMVSDIAHCLVMGMFLGPTTAIFLIADSIGECDRIVFRKRG